MKWLLIIPAVLLLSCKQEARDADALVKSSKTSEARDVPLKVYNFEELKPLLTTTNDTIYVVNFWATWCKPCIKELPYFDDLTARYSDKQVEVLLVSLDFPKKYDSHLKPYIAEHNLKSTVVALNDPDSNAWIPQVDSTWSGAIPATLIFNKNKRKFYEQTFTYETLEAEVKSFME